MHGHAMHTYSGGNVRYRSLHHLLIGCQLRVIAAQEDTSTQALIEQAIEMLFRSRTGAAK